MDVGWRFLVIVTRVDFGGPESRPEGVSGQRLSGGERYGNDSSNSVTFEGDSSALSGVRSDVISSGVSRLVLGETSDEDVPELIVGTPFSSTSSSS